MLKQALKDNPDMDPVDVARTLVRRHPDEQTRNALLAVVDLIGHFAEEPEAPELPPVSMAGVVSGAAMARAVGKAGA